MIEKNLRSQILAELGARADLIKLTAIEEPYFAALARALGEMPAERKDAAIQEVRAHLWAMVEAKRSDGLDEATAWLQATREFGEPAQVGRALHRQWVATGQMEESGEPLAKIKVALKWGYVALAGAWTIALFSFDHSTIFEACAWLLVMLSFPDIGRYQASNRGKWSFAGIFLNLVSLFALLNMLWMKDFQGTFWGDIWNYATLIVAMLYVPVYLRFRKKEIARRPWKTDRLFLRSPIAAEQKYRMEPRIVLSITAIFGCALTVSQSFGWLNWPLIILMCAAIVAAAFTANRWLAK